MGFIEESDVEKVKEELQRMKDPIKLVVFTQEFECVGCKENRELLEEVAGLSDKLSVEVYDFVKDKDVVDKYGVDKIPVTIILGPNDVDYGLRFFGIPAGYEFATLLDTVVWASRSDSGLEAGSRTRLKDVDTPLDVMVFVTPTCPYCPQAAKLAYRAAIENANITASVIEASEFPTLAQKYAVFGVPKVVISDVVEFTGALSEDAFISQILAAAEKLRGNG